MIHSMQHTIASIARNTLDIPTLECRNMDDLDFHEVSIWNLREALERAYRAGIAAGGRA